MPVPHAPPCGRPALSTAPAAALQASPGMCGPCKYMHPALPGSRLLRSIGPPLQACARARAALSCPSAAVPAQGRACGQMWGSGCAGLASVLISSSPQNATGGSTMARQPISTAPSVPQATGVLCSCAPRAGPHRCLTRSALAHV